jgi:hypothetical protein
MTGWVFPVRLFHSLLSAGFQRRTKRSAPEAIRVRAAEIGPVGRSVTLVVGKYDAKKPLTLEATHSVGADGRPLGVMTIKLGDVSRRARSHPRRGVREGSPDRPSAPDVSHLEVRRQLLAAIDALRRRLDAIIIFILMC